MSTVVVVRRDNDIVIGADSLIKFGSSKRNASDMKNSSKITKVGDTYIASVGNAVIDHILRRYFKNLDTIPLFDSVENIFNIACDLHKVLKEEYYLNPMQDSDDAYESMRMDCLIANKYGIFGLDSFRYAEEYVNYSAYGSGYRFAMGALKVAYEQNLPAEEVARLALEAAAEFDDSTGAPFEIY